MASIADRDTAVDRPECVSVRPLDAGPARALWPYAALPEEFTIKSHALLVSRASGGV